MNFQNTSNKSLLSYIIETEILDTYKKLKNETFQVKDNKNKLVKKSIATGLYCCSIDLVFEIQEVLAMRSFLAASIDLIFVINNTALITTFVGSSTRHSIAFISSPGCFT